LFLVLIIVNLGIFAWGMQREFRPPESGPSVDPGVPSLVLLNELDVVGEPDPAPPRAAIPDQVPAVSPGDSDLLLPSLLPESESDTTPADSPAVPKVVSNEGAERIAEAPAAEEPVGEGPSVEGPVRKGPAADGPVAEAFAAGPAQPIAAEKKIPESSLAGEEAPLPPPATPLPEPPEPNCFAVGPFPERSGAERLLARLRADALDARVRQRAQQEVNGYWVLIPPLASRAESAAEVNQIKAKGVEDVWRFDRGDMANGISLGLFARRDQAERHQSNLSRKDINAEVRPRYRERTAYYVDVGPSRRADLELTLAELIVREYPEQTRHTIVCP
jgi:cell division protein FtsN